MQERTVNVRNGAFQIQVAEAGSGDPLLFLHGFTGLKWDAFLDALATRYRIIAPLHPGFGRSTGNDELLDIHDLIYYYLDFLDTEKLRGLPLIGHSLGGMFAAELAAVQPERFSHLVLIDAFGLWNPDYPVLDFFIARPGELAEALYFDRESPAALTVTNPPAEGDAMIAYQLERAQTLATSAKYLWPIPNRGLSKRLHRITTPTLLIWGENDGIVPARYAADFGGLIPDATIKIVAEAAHLPQVEKPAQVAEVVTQFLAGKA